MSFACGSADDPPSCNSANRLADMTQRPKETEIRQPAMKFPSNWRSSPVGHLLIGRNVKDAPSGGTVSSSFTFAFSFFVSWVFLFHRLAAFCILDMRSGVTGSAIFYANEVRIFQHIRLNAAWPQIQIHSGRSKMNLPRTRLQMFKKFLLRTPPKNRRKMLQTMSKWRLARKSG